MLELLAIYGGAMTSSMIRNKMVLSKDEFYRTVKCAKNNELINVSPNPRDRRGYIIQMKSCNIQEEFFSNHSKNRACSK